MNLILIFLTGLTTGGLSCLALQGGLLASLIANQKKSLADSSSNLGDLKLVGMFLISKLSVHLVFGFLLGALGSVITLSLGLRVFFQVFTAFFMFATAGNLLNLHPIFRYFMFTPPKFLQKKIYTTSKSQALFAPVILGALTLFIPCGVTQAMEVLAINSGSPLTGALIMLAFILGTSPVFVGLGLATAKLSQNWQTKFMKVAALGLIFLALYNFNNALVTVDAPITAQKILAGYNSNVADNDSSLNKPAPITNPVQGVDTSSNQIQKVTINIFNNGYEPKKLRVKSGVPVELTLVGNNVYSCAAAFSLRAFNIDTYLQANDKKVFNFTPSQKGLFTYSCSMGMYSGVLEVY